MSQAVIDQIKAALQEQPEYIAYGKGEELTDVEGEFEIVDTVEVDEGRWLTYEEVIVQHGPTGDLYAFEQGLGKTEVQENEVYRDHVWPVTRKVQTVEIVTYPKVSA